MKPLPGDARSIGKARRQAGRRWLLPRRKPKPPRRLSDVLLREAEVGEWTANMVFAGRLRPRSPVGEIVGVRPIGDGREATRLGRRDQLAPQLGLAEIAAIAGVGSVPRIIQLRRVEL